jgi:hypothetical protein
MSPSAGANRAAGRRLLQQPSRALPVPPGTGQLPPGDHRRPRETDTGNIVRRSVERSFGWLSHWGGLVRDRAGRLDVAAARLALAAILSGVAALLNPMPIRDEPR